MRRVALPDLLDRKGVGGSSENGSDRSGRGRHDHSRRGPWPVRTPTGPMSLLTRLVTGPCPWRKRLRTIPMYAECLKIEISLTHLSRIRATGLPNSRSRRQMRKSKKKRIGTLRTTEWARSEWRGPIVGSPWGADISPGTPIMRMNGDCSESPCLSWHATTRPSKPFRTPCDSAPRRNDRGSCRLTGGTVL
jgi:hypothetical protein